MIKRFPGRRSLLMAALVASCASVSSSRAESRLPRPVALEGLSSVPVLVYVDGGDVLREDADDAMGDALEKEVIRTFQAAGYKSSAWRPTLTDTTHLDIRVSAWALEDVPKKALLVLNAVFVDQGRLTHGPDRSVEVMTWSHHDTKVIDVKGANRVIEKSIREAGDDFLHMLTWANDGEKRGNR